MRIISKVVARTGLKPFFISNRLVSKLKPMLFENSLRYNQLYLSYAHVLYWKYLARFKFIMKIFMNYRWGYKRYFDIILQPFKADTIIKLYKHIRIWQFYAYKAPKRRKYRRFVLRWKKKNQYYFTGLSMTGRRFGEFQKTKRSNPFRWHVNKKKFSKLDKDLQKARKKRIHNIKEGARLGKRARSMTRARLYGHTSRTQPRFWGPAMFHSEKKSGVTKRKSIRLANKKKRMGTVDRRK